MTSNKKVILFIFILFTFQFYYCVYNNNVENLKVQYFIAISDAKIAEPAEIYPNLIPILETNCYLFWKDKRVLVATWTKYPDVYRVLDTLTIVRGDVWVTVVPEIRDWFQSNGAVADTVLRIEQLLGLPPCSDYSYFIEMWVDPADLFRPAPDNEITDKICELDFPAGTDESYKQWFRNNSQHSYTPSGYPWTRLGYTYDWGPSESEIGLSEFVIKNGSIIIVKSVVSTKSYLNTLK